MHRVGAYSSLAVVCYVLRAIILFPVLKNTDL